MNDLIPLAETIAARGSTRVYRDCRVHDRRPDLGGTTRGAGRVGGEPVLSPTGDRIVGKRQTGARAEIVGDPHRRIWEQHGESLEAFEKRLAKAAADVARTQDFPPSER